MKFVLSLGAALVLATPSAISSSPMEAGLGSICGAESALSSGAAFT